jgi:hypothetical protein
VDRLANVVARVGTGSPLAALAAARDLAAVAAEAMQQAVDQARSAGHSWREIGDVLGTTRQAAFQRFGHPVDPRTSEPMDPEVPPGVVERAVTILGWFKEGRWADIIAELGEGVRARLEPDLLATHWAHLAARWGRLERTGEPYAFPGLDGAVTIVEIPLVFEAGDATGWVRFTADGEMAGLGVRAENT